MVPPTAFPSKEQNLVKRRSQGKTMNGNNKKMMHVEQIE